MTPSKKQTTEYKITFQHIKSIQDSVAASVNEKMASMIKKAILYQYATEVVLIILCLILSVFAVIDIRKFKQIYLYLKVRIMFM